MVIIGLGTNFWICLYWVAVLFVGFCFLFGFKESMLSVPCLVGWCAYREFLLVLELGERKRGFHRWCGCGKERLQLLFYCRAKGEWREWRRSTGSLPGLLLTIFLCVIWAFIYFHWWNI